MRIVKKHVLFMLVVAMVFSLFSASAFAQGHSANDPAALSKARQAVDDVIKDRAKSVAKLNLRNMNIQLTLTEEIAGAFSRKDISILSFPRRSRLLFMLDFQHYPLVISLYHF